MKKRYLQPEVSAINIGAMLMNTTSPAGPGAAIEDPGIGGSSSSREFIDWDDGEW